MPKVSLTDRFILTVKPEPMQIDYFDAKTTGLVLRVAPNAIRTWCLFYTSPKDGKRARTTLGHYPQTSLAHARTRALEAKAGLDTGTDPRDVAHHAMTVADLAASYMAQRVNGLRSAKSVEHRLAKNVLPVIGDVDLDKLHRRDILRVLDPIMSRGKKQEALAMFKHLRSMFAWAIERGYLDASPMTGVKAPAKGSVRERVLTEAETAAAWNADLSPTLSSLIRLCLLTGQRVGEVAGMTVSEIDVKARTWTIPAERSKNGFAHVVPLSDVAFNIIKAASKTGLIFPDAGNSACVGKALTRAKLGDWTMHDLRRTAVTGMQTLGISPIVAGYVIGHRSTTKSGITLSVYARYDYAKEKRQALDLWADRLAAIVTGSASKIIPLRAIDSAR
jgi:integrase